MNNISDSKTPSQFQNNVVLCHLLDLDFFLNFYEKSNLLKKYEEAGKRFFPSFHYLMEDLFYLLYKIVPTLKEQEEISLLVRPHLPLLKKIWNTSNTKNLRRRTKGNIINTYHALNFYIQWILNLLEDEKISRLSLERNEVLEEIQEVQKSLFKEEQRKNQFNRNEHTEDSENKEDQSREHSSEKQEIFHNQYHKEEGEAEESLGEGKEEEMERAGGAGEEFMEDTEPQSKEYVPGGEDPAQGELKGLEISNPKDGDMDKELELITKKMKTLQQKLRDLQKQDNILLEEYEKSLEEIHVEESTEQGIFLLEDLEHKMESIGSSTQNMKSLSFDFIIHLSETLKNSKVEQLINRIGRTRRLARKGQKKRKKKFKGIQSRNTLSDDLNSITEDEYLVLGLGIEALELDFYDRYLNARLSTWEGSRIEKKRKGPIIVCYDGSASMEGERILEAKAHLFAFIDIAKKQKRKMVTIQFSSNKDELLISELEPYKENIGEIVHILEGFIGKGTDFEKPLSKSLEYIRHHGFKDADIIFMTDGESEMDEELKKEFKQHKETYHFKMIGILIHFSQKEYRDIQELCDEVYYVKEGEWEEAISEKLFGI